MRNSDSAATVLANNDISLFDLLQILVKRKWLIVTTVVVCLIGGAIFFADAPPTSEVSATLKIGQVRNYPDAATLLENPADLIARLSAQGAVKASLQSGTHNIINLKAVSTDENDASKRMRSVIDGIMQSHASIYEDNVQPVSERLARLKLQKQSLENELSTLIRLVDKIRESDPAQASILVLQRSNLTSMLYQIDNSIAHLSQQLSGLQTRPSELVVQIKTVTKTNNSKKSVRLALVVLFGLMVGVMLALVSEFFSKIKINRSASK